MSGSTNASDIALRRKLEAELYEAKESLSDTYYDHAKDQQQSALDEEAEAFSKSKEKYIEELEKQLEDSETLIQNSLMDMLLNADAVYTELNGIADTYGITLSNELVEPWKNASAQATAWKNELQTSMTSGEYAALIGEDGAITAFANGVATKLEGSWNSAQTAAQNYVDFLTNEELGNNFGKTITGFGTQIQSLVTYWNNVKNAAEAAHAEQERKVTVGGNPNVGKEDGSEKNKGGDDDKDNKSSGSNYDNGGLSEEEVKEMQKYLGVSVDGKWGPNSQAEAKNQWGVTDANGSWSRYRSTHNQWKSYQDASKAGYANIRTSSEFGRAGNNDKKKYKTYQRYLDAMYHKYKLKGYAKGTIGTTKDQWAITDEIGDELVLVPGPNGNLSFMRKGTSVVPSDITTNLVEWGKLNPDMLNTANPTAGINMISNAINKPELNISFDSLIKAENITEETLPAVKKLVTQELNRFTKELNYALKGKGAR